ncbi:MAG TPA: DinB family protein [Thermoanaerobaculia bacterium]|nr:DinB family protein [Thermoanaerobaculia bacterium]
MSLLPEQERALAYVRRRGTEAPLEAIRSRVAGTYAEIEALVEGVAEGLARQRPEPGSWSVLEVVDHLVESDRPAVAQLRELLAGRSSEQVIAAGMQSTDPSAQAWTALLASFRAVHGEILALLDGADDTLPLTATAPVEMVVKHTAPEGTLRPVHWVERFDWKAYAILLHAHNREHISQVQRILGKIHAPE